MEEETVASPTTAWTSDQRAIRATMDAWIDAVQARNDKRATAQRNQTEDMRKASDEAMVALVSENGVKRFDEFRDLALYGKSEQIERLPMTQQMQVYLLRFLLDPDELQDMSSQEVLSFALREKFIAIELRRGDVLRNIVVDGNRARGTLYYGSGDQASPQPHHFVREDGEWRIDLEAELDRVERDFENFRKRQGTAPAEAAFTLLELRLFRKITPTDFVAPLKRGAAEGKGVL